MPDGVKIVLGLVTTKTGAMEDRDELRSRVGEAARIIPEDHLALSPQCGFASVDVGNLISYQDQKAKLAMVVELAQTLWN